MAPGLVESNPIPSHKFYTGLSKYAFPDGIKTSGQHPPVYDLLHPYSDFPNQITGPTVWKADYYANHPERWTHPFTTAEIAELSDAADRFLASGSPLTGISKVSGVGSLFNNCTDTRDSIISSYPA